MLFYPFSLTVPLYLPTCPEHLWSLLSFTPFCVHQPTVLIFPSSCLRWQRVKKHDILFPSLYLFPACVQKQARVSQLILTQPLKVNIVPPARQKNDTKLDGSLMKKLEHCFIICEQKQQKYIQSSAPLTHSLMSRTAGAGRGLKLGRGSASQDSYMCD